MKYYPPWPAPPVEESKPNKGDGGSDEIIDGKGGFKPHIPDVIGGTEE